MSTVQRNRYTLLTSLSVLLLCTSAAVNAKPNQASPLNIKDKMIEKCTNDGVKMQIGNKENLSKLCTCTIGIQASKLTLGEYWEIQSAAVNGKDPRAVKPLMRIQPQLDACAKGLTLNIPTQVPNATGTK